MKSKLGKNITVLNKYLKEKITALDLGADGGLSKNWLDYIDLMKVFAFEPNKEEFNRLKKESHKNITWVNQAASYKTGNSKIYIPKRTTGASLLEPNMNVHDRFGDSNYWGKIQKKNIFCISLKDYLKNQKINKIDLIKLDTQGSELSILKGMGNSYLSSLLAIEVEVEFVEFYKNQPLFFDINKYLTSKGFELIDLRTARSFYSKDNKANFFVNKYLNSNGNSPLLGSHLVSGDAFYVKKN